MTTTWNRGKRKVIGIKIGYGAIWHKIDIGAGMTTWIKSPPIDLHIPMCIKPPVKPTPKPISIPRAMMRGNIMLVA